VPSIQPMVNGKSNHTDIQSLQQDNINKSSLKSVGKSRDATPHGRKWTRPLHVLAVQCPLQTRPVTHPRVRHIHNAVTVPVPHILALNLGLLAAKLLHSVIFFIEITVAF